MKHWAFEAVFYHIYPLGFCGAPQRNDFSSPQTPRLEQIYGWLDHLRALGINALYLGPLFESSAHGYDTADYFHVDRRLGSNQLLTKLVRVCHENGMRVILDGVINHVGRDFWAFRDVREKGQESAYQNWFQGLSFSARSPYNDDFIYEGWHGHYDLVKLNLQNPAVKDHLFQAVERWMDEFQIDGLRLDAADCIDKSFLKELAAFCKARRDDFWLMGEVVHGDYRNWANAETLDSVTNYEAYKSLYSSHVDKNYYEIAYTLNREFGENGLYRGIPLYNFADNHDVNRVASNLRNPAHLYPLYILLFSMPGVPAVYYGSEWGIAGKREKDSDRKLRPYLDLTTVRQNSPNCDLVETITRLARIRRTSSALQYGDYQQLYLSHEQLAFARQAEGKSVIVIVNSSDQPATMNLKVPVDWGDKAVDLLNPGEKWMIGEQELRIGNIWPRWGKILEIR